MEIRERGGRVFSPLNKCNKNCFYITNWPRLDRMHQARDNAPCVSNAPETARIFLVDSKLFILCFLIVAGDGLREEGEGRKEGRGRCREQARSDGGGG